MREVGGVPKFLLLIGIIIFLLVRSPCKILEPYDNPFWDFSNGRESGIIPKKVAYLSCSAVRTHFARTKIVLEGQDFYFIIFGGCLHALLLRCKKHIL